MVYILDLLNSSRLTAICQYHLGVQQKLTNSKINTEKQRKQHNNSEDYIINNKLVNWIAHASSELAGEPFYHVFYPSCAWLFEVHLARKNILMLSTMMYIGQALKDIIKQPRPESPPVIRLESTYVTEYGMPSTHSVLGVTVPFSFILFLSQTYEVPPYYYKLAVVWSSLVATSRIYLGMHTAMQVIVGCFIPAVTITVVSPYIDLFEKMQIEGSSYVSFVTALVIFGASGLLFYIDRTVDLKTKKIKWTSSRGDTAEILGWCAGFLIGTRWCQNNLLHEINYSSILNKYFGDYPTCYCLFKFISGAVILAPSTLLVRKIFCHLFIFINGKQHEPIFISKKQRLIEWPYKFLSVFTSATMATCIIPRLYKAINLW